MLSRDVCIKAKGYIIGVSSSGFPAFYLDKCILVTWLPSYLVTWLPGCKVVSVSRL